METENKPLLKTATGSPLTLATIGNNAALGASSDKPPC